MGVRWYGDIREVHHFGGVIVPRHDWLAQARHLPLAFAQVREDPWQDVWLALRQHQARGAALRIALTASGGCTAATLAACAGVGSLHLVDANPAQLALTRLKLYLLQTVSSAERMRLLGHTPMPVAERHVALESVFAAVNLEPDVFGPMQDVATRGPDFSGRYEWLFAALRQDLAQWRDELDAVLALRNPVEQARLVAPDTALGEALDRAYDAAFDLDVLVQLFGEGATANRVEPFARHFARRTRHVLATLPAADNPYLWQLLAGRYPGVTVPWLAQEAPVLRLPEITVAQNPMDEALAAVPPGQFDIIHVSNILDWLTPTQARVTLERVWQALRPGGIVVVRQLNSTLDVHGCGPEFRWDPVADELHSRDRSFFYRALHIGAKP
ncbi:methylase [Mycobacterium haemophilum DSM 44634]|nr:methylase [Mycobacterium haemophilum DSM 44634]